MIQSTEQFIDGRCQCGRGITKILNSSMPTMWINGDHYIYQDRVDTGWCIFRCESCGEPISKTWKAATN